MKYKITFRKRASNEYLDALLWYKVRSIDAAENFVKAIDETLGKIAGNPAMFRNPYSNFYEASTKKYPFSIVYFVDESEKRVLW